MKDVISQINHIKESLKTGIEVEAQSLLFQKLIEVIELQQRKLSILENDIQETSERVRELEKNCESSAHFL